MSTLTAYSALGGDLYPKIDTRAYPFDDALSVPMTIKEQRLENIPTTSPLSLVTSAGSSIRLEYNVAATSDQSMYDLNGSFWQLQVNVPALSSNQGIAQFAINNMLVDCTVFLGSTVVSESHAGGLYPWQALVKDLLTLKRPCAPSVAAAATTGCVNDMTENFLEEGNYLSYALTTPATADAGSLGALALTKVYCSNSTIYMSLRIKDGIFLTQKYLPANLSLKIVLNITLANMFQENPGATDISSGGARLSAADFLLNRVFLGDEAQKAQNMALLQSPFKYVLPYSRAETRLLSLGSTSYNISNLFQGQTKPDLLCLMFQNTVTKSWPLVACGSGFNAPVISQLYAKFNGHQFPKATCYPLATDIRTYREYVKQCLPDSEDVYLDYLHWKNHYTVYAISLRDDQEKIYDLAPSGQTGGIDVRVVFPTALGANTTVYAVALTHVKLEIDNKGLVTRFNYD